MNVKISASILSADFGHLEDQIRQCERAKVDWIHIDVMDGHFVPNLTMGPFIVQTCNQITNLPLDCHLMVDNPQKLVDAFVMAGADIITIHSEDNPDVLHTLKYIKDCGVQAGLAINPTTLLASVNQYFEYLDLVLIMTVYPGYSGQGFMPEVVQKIVEMKQLMAKYPNIKHLQVDGGINQSTIRTTIDAGANCCVAATAIFKNPLGIENGVESLRSQIK